MFEREFDLFWKEQVSSASGRRLERLNQDLIGEKKMFREVLWPVFKSFDGFTLEYEMKSTSGISIFVDAFYQPLKFAFESEGFVPHAEKITRDRYSFERKRIRSMVLYGYKYIPFSWDEIEKDPEGCRRSVYELIGRFSGSDEAAYRDLSVYEREVIRYVLYLNRQFRVEDVSYCLQLEQSASRRVLRKLLEKQLIRPAGKGRQKIRIYELTEQASKYML